MLYSILYVIMLLYHIYIHTPLGVSLESCSLLGVTGAKNSLRAAHQAPTGWAPGRKRRVLPRAEMLHNDNNNMPIICIYICIYIMYSNIIIVYYIYIQYIVHVPGNDDRQDNKSNHQHKKHQGWWRVIITIVTMRWIWYEYQHSSTSNTGLFPITMLTVGGFNIVQVLFVIGLIGSSQVGNKPLNGIIGSGLMDIDGHWWTSFWWKSLKFFKPNWSIWSLTNFCQMSILSEFPMDISARR